MNTRIRRGDLDNHPWIGLLHIVLQMGCFNDNRIMRTKPKSTFSILATLFRVWMMGVLCVPGVAAQQTYLTSLGHVDKYLLNPAYGGMDNRLSLSAVYRAQWQGLTGSPEVMAFSAHAPLYAISAGAGMRVANHRIGLESDIRVSWSYNQVIPFSFGILAVGAHAGWLRKTLDGAGLVSPTDGLPGTWPEDPFIPRQKISGNTGVWGIGWYFFTESFDFGMVFEDIPQIEIDLGEIDIQKRYSFTVHGNYSLLLSDLIRMELFSTVRTDLVQWQTEGGVMGTLDGKWFSSLLIRGYDKRSIDALSVMLGGRFNENLTFAYSYDITLSPLQDVSNGSHEFMLRYLLDVNTGKKIPERIIHHPRLYE